jgi:flagellar hook-basal body complex protein FliE
VSAIAAIAPFAAVQAAPLALQLGPAAPMMQIAPQMASQAAPPGGFGALLMAGLRSIDAKVGTADALVRRFAVDDDVPVHQVTMALEDARLSVELAMQVRTRLLEGYRELMGMQL